MSSTFQSIIRCLCPCLITSSQSNHLIEVTDEQHKFLSKSEMLNDELKNKNVANTPKSQQTSKQPLGYTQQINEQPQLLGADTSVSPSQAKNIMDAQEQDPNYVDYLQYLPKDHPYYELLAPKLEQKLDGIFQVQSDFIFLEPMTQYDLKIYSKSKGRNNAVFIYFYTFPTDIATFEDISTDYKLQQKFDSNIESYHEVIESVSIPNTKIISLAYKKMLLFSSRDFQYVRFTFRHEQQYWIICVSDKSRGTTEGKIRGQIILTATKIIQRTGRIEVSVYSQVDMKLNGVKPDMTRNRGMTEIRKYLDRVYEHIQAEIL